MYFWMLLMKFNHFSKEVESAQLIFCEPRACNWKACLKQSKNGLSRYLQKRQNCRGPSIAKPQVLQKVIYSYLHGCD